MKEQIRIIVMVRGGMVQAVYGSNKTVRVGVLDYDILQEETDKESKAYLKALEKEIKELDQIW